MKWYCELKITYLHFIPGDVERVEQQLSNGVDINIVDNYQVSALHLAIRSGAENVVEFLLKNGANIEAKDFVEDTPLHTSARYGKIFMLLLKVLRSELC